ncbi:MAG: hypothetical protein HYT20_02390 [Candidatus Nealsonbacteria bacterium]|nr:hypothetical protein [Candidatus Nealsonbacteria bacterium]
MTKTKIKIAHQDKRGNVSDILYKTSIEHVSVLNTKKAGALRGDHYHKKTIQSMYMSRGSLRYYYREYDKTKKQWGKVKSVVVKEGEMVTTPPYEIHALEILNDNQQFFVFTHGQRGGEDYESDTFRVKPSLITQAKWKKFEEKLP